MHGKRVFQGCCVPMWSAANPSFGVRVGTARTFCFQWPYQTVHWNECFILRGKKASSVPPSVINTALFSIPSQAGSTHKLSGCLGICVCTQVRSCSENSCVSGTHHLQHQEGHYKEELKNKLHFL